MTDHVRLALGLGSLMVFVACGSSPGDTRPAASSGGEQVAAAPTGPPPPATQIAAGQATASPATEAVALAKVTSHAEPREKIKDAVKVSPDIYRVVVESTRMRLLVATWEPGQVDEPHGHPPLIVYALNDLEGLATGHGGHQKRVKLSAGASFYQNPVKSHTFKNVGDKPARMLILELSQRVDPMEMPAGAAPDAMAASPDVYRRVFEDEHVRVLHASWEPGQMDRKHSHPELAAYALTELHGKLHGDDGVTRDLQKPAGGGVFQDPVKGHTYENVGKTRTEMVLFEPKGGAARASSAAPGSFKNLPVERGDGDVVAFVDSATGVKMDIGRGFTLEIPTGVDFTNVVTFATTRERPKDARVAKGFRRHGETLEFDGLEEALDKQVVLGTAFPRMPVKAGHRFVLAMEVSGDCKGAARRHRLPEGGCSHWQLLATQYDAARKKVIVKLGSTGGYRLQFGWVPE